jgi:excisionase family DNA binding protein
MKSEEYQMVTATSDGEQLLLTVEEAARRLSLHRSRLFPLMAKGAIGSLKIGKSRRIPLSELQRFVEAEMERQCGARSSVA